MPVAKKPSARPAPRAQVASRFGGVRSGSREVGARKLAERTVVPRQRRHAMVSPPKSRPGYGSIRVARTLAAEHTDRLHERKRQGRVLRDAARRGDMATVRSVLEEGAAALGEELELMRAQLEVHQGAVQEECAALRRAASQSPACVGRWDVPAVCATALSLRANARWGRERCG